MLPAFALRLRLRVVFALLAAAVVCMAATPGVRKLALRIGVDRRTLVNWLSRQHIRLEHMVCVCVGLRLRGDLGLTLVELAGCRIHRTPLHDILRMMLMSAPSLTVERCNEILTRQGYPTLHGGEPPWPE